MNKISKEEVDKLFEQKMNEWNNLHKAWIHTIHGSTYIGFDIYDIETYCMMERIKSLVLFIGEQYVTFGPCAGIDGDKDSYYIIIPGEDKERADFIQRFIDNHYMLNWRKKENQKC